MVKLLSSETTVIPTRFTCWKTVNEVDVNKLSVGQTGKVTFSALPDVTLDAMAILGHTKRAPPTTWFALWR